MSNVNQYGPWATSIDACGNPQLSTFWRRRLTMLVPVSQTSPVLSRRNLLCLGAMAVLMLVLPTFHFATAADKKEPAEQSSKTKASEPVAKASLTKETTTNTVPRGSFICFSDCDDSAKGANAFLSLPICVYFNLCNRDVRKELKITDDQEKKLREMSRNYVKDREKRRKQMAKDAMSLTPEERIAKQTKYLAIKARESNACRKQIEELLTAEQLTALRSIFVGLDSQGRRWSEPQFREKIGITDRQHAELKQLSKSLQQQEKRYMESEQAIEQRRLAVITPQQWEKLEQADGKNESDEIPDYTYPSTEFMELLRENVCKQLALSDEQQTKVREICNQAQQGVSNFNTTSDGLSPKELATQQSELMREITAAKQKGHKQIGSVLTKQQSAALKKLVVRSKFLGHLNTYLFCGPSSPPSWLGRLVSKEQWQDLIRLHAEGQRTMLQHFREVGESQLKILSREQQDKFIDELDRLMLPPEAPPSATKDDKSDSTKKVSGYVMTLSGSSVAAGDEEAGEKKGDEKATPQHGNLILSGANSFAGDVSADASSGTYLLLPTDVYNCLCQGETRKELKITDDQEKKLREMSSNYHKEREKLQKQMEKEAESLTPEERIAKQSKYLAILARELSAGRKQIEELLTAEQLTALQSIGIGRNGEGRLLSEPQLQRKIGITDQQHKELDQLAKSLQQQQMQFWESLQTFEQRMLAVITPQQWDKLEQADGKTKSDEIPDYNTYPRTELMELLRRDVCKQLGLNAKQQTKVREIWSQVQPDVLNLNTNGGLSPKEQATQQSEMMRKMAAAKQKDHEKIESVLTKQQSAALKKLVLHRKFFGCLDMVLFSRPSSPPGWLGRLISKEQWQDLIRLHAERERMTLQYFRKAGESQLKILSREQQDKFIEELDRRMFTPEPTPSATEEGKSDSTKKVSIGVVTLGGLSVATGDEEAVEPTPSESTKKPNAPTTLKNAK